MGPSVNSLHRTLFTLFFFVLDKLIHRCYGLLSCFFVFSPSPRFLKTVMRVALPPLFLLISSKVINVVYSAELVCIPLVWLCKAILSRSTSVHYFHLFFFSLMGIWMNVFLLTFILNPSTPHPYFQFSPLYPAFLSKPASSSTLPSSCFWLLSQPYIV